MIRATQEASNEVLCVRYQAGDASALAELVERNQGLVWRVARYFFTDETDAEDAVQEGNLCLLDCAAGFKAELGFRFSTYAMHALKTRLYRFRNKNRLMPLPVAFRGPWEDLPTQVADTDLFLAHLVEGGQSPTEAIEAAEEQDHLRIRLNKRLNRLRPNHRRVIRERLKGKTLEEVGREMGICKERVRQIQNEAIKAMRGRNQRGKA